MQRKKTLLKEYEERDRSGGILDRRFGESDPSMTPEERMLERFTREKQRVSRSAVFNLDDEEELTHYGQSLSNLDDFDNTGLTLDDEDELPGVLVCAIHVFVFAYSHSQVKLMAAPLRENTSVDLTMKTAKSMY